MQLMQLNSCNVPKATQPKRDIQKQGIEKKKAKRGPQAKPLCAKRKKKMKTL
jgi:hypothetical protein